MRLQLSYPVNNPIINQLFGNKDPMYSQMGMLGHNGIDFYAPHGTPIYATHDGLASFQIDSGGGHGVVIITDKPVEVNGVETYVKTIYWHMVDGLKEPKYQSPIADKTGFVKVSNGELIGYANNTGASTGDHLHFGCKTVDKGEYPGTWMNTEVGNGYFGAFDPKPFFDGSTPAQIQLLEKQISFMQKLILLYKQLKNK